MARTPQRKPNRRSVLKAGAAGLLAPGLGCGRKTSDTGQSESESDTGTADTTGQIDHVIVLMMENRTFDHYLGSLSLLEGWDVEGDVDGSRPSGGFILAS